MTRLSLRSHLWLTLPIAAALLLAAPCGGDGDTPAAPTETAVVTAASTPPIASPTSPYDVAVMTPSGPGEAVFGREPAEEPGDATRPAPLLIGVETGTLEQFDRVLFRFDGGIPGYRVEYVSPPVAACGSGLPVEIAGDALLQVRMSPAAAHNDAATPTFDRPEVAPSLPALLEIEQTCDFEGVLVWVLGLTEEVDFRVFALTDAFLVVDVRHP